MARHRTAIRIPTATNIARPQIVRTAIGAPTVDQHLTAIRILSTCMARNRPVIRILSTSTARNRLVIRILSTSMARNRPVHRTRTANKPPRTPTGEPQATTSIRQTGT